MGQSQLQQSALPESVLQPQFQFIVVGHDGSQYNSRLKVQTPVHKKSKSEKRRAHYSEFVMASTFGAASAEGCGSATGGLRPCSSRSATSCCTFSSWLSCRLGSMIVNKSPLA